MITSAGYFDWMLQAPGVPDKVYSERPKKKLYKVNHSIVGTYDGAIGRLMSEQKDASGRYTPYSAASVTYINPKAPMEGADAVQMYDVFSACWASGTREANINGLAGELEGGPPGNTREPMNDHQLKVELRVLRDMRDFFDWPDVRVGVEVREHNEFQATACPSGRYAKLYEAIAAGKLEDEMTRDEVLALVNERIDAALAFQFPILAEALVSGGFTAEEVKPHVDAFLAAVGTARSPSGLTAEALGMEVVKLGQRIQMLGRGV